MEATIQTAFDYIQIRQTADLSCLFKVSARPIANAVVTHSYAKATYVETFRNEIPGANRLTNLYFPYFKIWKLPFTNETRSIMIMRILLSIF